MMDISLGTRRVHECSLRCGKFTTNLVLPHTLQCERTLAGSVYNDIKLFVPLGALSQ